MDRREFIYFIGLLTSGFMLPNSNLSAKEIERMLQNEDKKGFNIRFYKPFGWSMR